MTRSRRVLPLLGALVLLVAAATAAGAVRGAPDPVTRDGAIARANADCRQIFAAAVQVPRDLATDEGRKVYAAGLLEVVREAILLTTQARVPAEDRAVVRRVRADLEAAEVILRRAQRSASLHDLSKSEERLRRATVALVDYGAEGCLPPPRVSPARLSPESPGSLVELSPSAVITVGPPGVDNNRIVADERAVWVGLKNANEVVRIDPTDNRVVASVPIEQSPSGQLILVDGYLWTFGEQGLLRVNPRTNRVDRRIPRSALGVAATDRVWVTRDAIWSCTGSTGVVRRSDLVTGRRVAEIQLPTLCFEVTADRENVWIGGTSFAGDHYWLHRLDARANRLTGSTEIALGARLPVRGQGSIWMDTALGAYEIADDASGVVGIAPRPGEGGAFVTTFGAGAFWTTREPEQRVLRIDAQTLLVEELQAGPGVIALAVAGGVLWASNSDDGTVMRFDVEPWVGEDGGG